MFLRYHIFSIFQMAIGHHVEFLKGKILFEEGVWSYAHWAQSGPSAGQGPPRRKDKWVWRTKARHHAKFCSNWSINCGDIAIFFQDGDRPPSWSCLGHIWTTHRKYCAKFSYDDAIVLIIWKFQYFAHLGGNAYSRPEHCFFSGYYAIWPPKWTAI